MHVKIMKTINLLKILQKYAIFTENDVAKIVKKKPQYVKTLVYRLNKQKMVNKIERGKYTLNDDVLIFSSYIMTPSYIGLWSAIRYYNLTEQMPKTIFVMVPRSRSSLRYKNILIEFVKTKYFFGYKKENYRGFEIFMAEPEKAIIDSLISKKVPLDEIISSIKNKSIDTKKLINYAIKTKNKSLIKRLGFILEENKYNLQKRLKFVDNNYVVLDTALEKKGKLIKKWRIIDNRK